MRVYDKKIIIQRVSASGEWVDWKQLNAFVNKTKDSTSSLTFEVRYSSSLRDIFSYLEEFLIIYRGDVYLIEDYDDFMEQHLTIRFKTSILRLGKFSGTVSILQKTSTQDDDGFILQSESVVEIVPCYHESRQASVRWANLATFTEVTDLFQIEKPSGYTLSRAYMLEHTGDRFEILSIEHIKGHGKYLQILAKCVSGAVR